MKPIIFSLFADVSLVHAIAETCDYEVGEIIFRQFPDKETYLKINSVVQDREIIFIASLDRPDDKFLLLLFAAQTARDLGAKKIGLVAPYLPYMRQDKRFNPGEAITAKYFARLISDYFDWLITVDPHLHRFHSLNEIYAIPSIVLHATHWIAEWIKLNVVQPVIIGPDLESEQWVASIAEKIPCPYLVAEKVRQGDRAVTVSLPNMEKFKKFTPVLVDDVISSGVTMMEAVLALKKLVLSAPICIGVHAVFADDAYADLLKVGAAKVVTCNSISHISNDIDLSSLICEGLREIKNEAADC